MGADLSDEDRGDHRHRKHVAPAAFAASASSGGFRSEFQLMLDSKKKAPKKASGSKEVGFCWGFFNLNFCSVKDD